MSGNSDLQRRHVYGRRKGHSLRAGQAKLVRELLPQLRVDVDAGATGNPRDWFGAEIRAVWLEIGFGGGEHLFSQAQAHPDRGILGCEPFINGVAKLLSAVDRVGLSNVRIHDGDARDLLERLPDGCIERVFILYPDPWPKTRHHKRRFICAENLDQIARIMTPGGELRFASDIPDYVRWTLSHMRRHPAFEWTAERPDDWRTRRDDWPGTRYETKALDAGRIPSYLMFRRV